MAGKYDGDGLRAEGRDKRTGKLRYSARITARHPDTGAKVVDTEHVILADNKAAALIRRDELRDELLAKKLGRLGKTSRIKLADAFAGWLAECDRFSTHANYRSCAKRISAHFGDRWIDSLEVDECQRYLTLLGKARSASSVGNHKSTLVGAYQWAIDQGHAKAPNPLRALRIVQRKSSEKRRRQLEAGPEKRWATREELPAYLSALLEIEPVVYRMQVAQVSIGSRFSEVSALQRSDIDWRTGAYRIVRAQVNGHIGPPKDDARRPGAFPPSVLEMLRGHVAEMERLRWPGYETWLFPRNPFHPMRVEREPLWRLEQANKAIKAAKKASGVHTVNASHLARHTLIGLMREVAAADVLRPIVGHTARGGSHDDYGEHRVAPAKVHDFAREVERVVPLRKRDESAT